MRLRPVERRDLETIRLLRNRCREAFFDDREIAAAAQVIWFESLDRTRVAFFVLEEGGRVVGTISVTASAAEKEIGNLLLDAAYRGRGLMRRAVEELTREPGRYVAYVKPGNRASANVFVACGFAGGPAGFEKCVRPSAESASSGD